jgi:mono/diheme cytochrome c family protein
MTATIARTLMAVSLFSTAAAGVARAEGAQSAADKKKIARGQYLVMVGGCNDCHTPLKMGPKGPEPDMTRMLSGHPEALVMPPSPKLPPGPWLVSVAATLTSWSGPWGTSFTANLTPDKETGLGKWTVRTFKETLRTGRDMGHGRPILPPMPWFNYGKMTDEDLDAVFAYLQSIPPIKNRVPQPLPPPAPPSDAHAAAKP